MVRLLFWSFLAILTGCAAQPPRQMFDGPSQPAERVAVVHIPPYRHAGLFTFDVSNWLEVRSVDGRPVRNNEDGRPGALIVLPGQRRLTVRAMYTTASGGVLDGIINAAIVENVTRRFERELILDALAGREYELQYELIRPAGFIAPVTQWKAEYWILDRATGAVVTPKVQ